MSTKRLTIGILVCYATLMALACVERDVSEFLGWLCASAWAIQTIGEGEP